MAKKQSKIDAESRTEVAENNKVAETAEIAANQEVAIRDQHAQELVGKRTAEKDQNVGIATEQANQAIQTEAATTKTREMAVLEVETVRTAEINKAALIVAASQERDTTVIKAEGIQKEQVIKAEGVRQETEVLAAGVLVQQTKEAEGTLAVGTAEAEAKRLAEMALVTPQIALATEIGDNDGYQTYLIQIRNVEKDEVVGVENAKALQAAGIKVIANTGTNITDGVQSVSDLFTSKGGLAIGSTLEGLANTPGGKAALAALGVDLEDSDAPMSASSRPARGNGAAA
jgi:flotillin